jgi:hypothetical protein
MQSGRAMPGFPIAYNLPRRSALRKLFIPNSALGFVISLLLFGSMFPSTALAGPQSYADELIETARQLRLSEHPIWLRLVHYKHNHLLPGYTSFADDPNFFNSPKGKEDPEAELEATLRAFFSHEPETEEHQHPQCAFVARYFWLNQQLHFDPQRLPEQPCRRFHEWRDALDPANITLIYPAAYLNNPASMFGHTLLRIDATGQTEETRLLAYGASYAAATAERNGLAFAFRGIFGGYKGVFSIAPYYKQVAKYSDLENRDIWEYELEFNAEEREQMIRHLWELGAVYFDYYFFDENCAYHLLSLFDAVRPSLDLSGEFPLWAIPSDTVRAVARYPGLVKKIVYRPSNSTTVKSRLKEMSPADSALALKLVRGEIAPDAAEVRRLPDYEHARVLELGFDYANYLRLSGKDPANELSGRARKLLLARSSIAADIPPFIVPTPSVRPDQGHETARLGLSGGFDDGRLYQKLQYRPAYHDLLDPPAGYTSGAELRFFDLTLRQDEGDSLRLDNFTPLAIRSLSPRDDYFKPISWKVDVGIRRQELPDRRHGILLTQGEGGAGVSYQPLPGVLTFALLETALQYTTDYTDDLALGILPDIGAYADLSEKTRVGVRGRSAHFFLGEEHREQSVQAEARYLLTPRISLRAMYEYRFQFGDHRNTQELGCEFYF